MRVVWLHMRERITYKDVRRFDVSVNEGRSECVYIVYSCSNVQSDTQAHCIGYVAIWQAEILEKDMKMLNIYKRMINEEKQQSIHRT